jgi:deazaflavin-dependent oxidoreductase (nitroreductase family)
VSTDEPLVADLVANGAAVVLETTGRSTGRTRRAAVGFLDEPDGSLLVAAGDDAQWARNLEVDPHCRVIRDGTSFDCVAERLEGPAREATIVSLILRYGTPAERLGRGPAFRLRRVRSGERPRIATDGQQR